jgi:hypothetical protein
MATHLSEESWTVAGRFEIASEQGGSKVTSDDGPTAIGPFAAVEGIFPGYAFTPTIYTVAMYGQ